MTSTATETRSLVERAAPYLHYVEHWVRDRPLVNLSDIIQTARDPSQIAVVSVDLIVGFCHSGPLSSQRIAGVLPAVRRLFEQAHNAGIESFVLTQDTHLPDAEEFQNYPAHCVKGTKEAQTVPELASLPFADTFAVVEKNSIASLTAPAFSEWEEARGPFTTYIVVGDCTDLCVYQAAMALKLRSIAGHLGQRVIVPIDCVETYDLPVEDALATGAQPHDGDLLHHVFLHSMAQNGVEIVAGIR